MLIDQRLAFLLQLGDLPVNIVDFMLDIIVMLAQQLFGLTQVRSRRRRAFQRLVGRFLHELVDSPEPWKVIYQDPRTSTPGLGLLLWMQKVYGDDAPQAWQKLAAKTVTVTKGWSEAYGLFLKGEADLVLSYTTSPAYHIIEEKKENYVAAPFSEGHYLQVEVAGRLASSQQPQLAERFLKFMVSPAFQQLIPTTNWMYPVIDTPLPAGFQRLDKPATTLSYTPQQVAAQRNDWIQAWQRAVSR